MHGTFTPLGPAGKKCTAGMKREVVQATLHQEGAILQSRRHKERGRKGGQRERREDDGVKEWRGLQFVDFHKITQKHGE